MKKIILLLLTLTHFICFAQQDPLYTQYINNPFIVNAAVAGLHNDFTGNISYRSQWQGFDGAPETWLFSGSFSLKPDKMGAGLNVMRDRIGTSNTTDVQAAFSYAISIAKNKKLHFGMQAGFVNFKSDFSSLNIAPNDPFFQENISEMKPSLGAGVLLTADSWILGFSAPRMMRVTSQIDETTTALFNQQFFFHGAYVLEIAPRYKVKPFTLVRLAPKTKSSFDIGATVIGVDKYGVGLFTRNFHTAGLNTLLNVSDAIRVGYVFEVPIRKMASQSFVTHEFTLILRAKALRFHDIESINDF
ncbi:MAG: PorP/SprF family type IX secretion system membrane protein [Cyclobacteriaceae bacterium]|nr:PorP/SprF family type IX secretion system membrane protein [Cytophagales bacterium]MCZ8328815.1 PorP/SprF family type IX secretion system membrane protein [Cyclobacteriaceae bacterium]